MQLRILALYFVFFYVCFTQGEEGPFSIRRLLIERAARNNFCSYEERKNLRSEYDDCFERQNQWNSLQGNQGHTAKVSLANDLVATGGFGDELKIWDANTGVRKGIANTRCQEISHSISEMSEGLIAEGSGRLIAIYDVQSVKDLYDFDVDESPVISVSLNGGFLAAGLFNGCTKVWDINNKNSFLHILKVDTERDWASSISMDNGLIVVSHMSHRAQLWNVNNGEYHSTIVEPVGCIISVSMHGNLVASGLSNKVVKVYDVITGADVNLMQEHKLSVDDVSMHGNLVASGSYDGTVKVGDVRTGTCNHTFKGHLDSITSVSLSEQYVASGSYNGVVKIWDLRKESETLAQQLLNIKARERSYRQRSNSN